jgi:hypothetical protein
MLLTQLYMVWLMRAEDIKATKHTLVSSLGLVFIINNVRSGLNFAIRCQFLI